MTSSSHRVKKTRFFNTLEDHGDFYKKTSTDKHKLFQEYDFIKTCPRELKSYLPEVKDFSSTDNSASYYVRKIEGVEASHPLMKGDDNEVLIVLKLVKSFLNSLPSVTCSLNDFAISCQINITQKNLDRLAILQQNQNAADLNKIAQRYGHNGMEKYVLHLNNLTLSALQGDHRQLYHIHGDLCFSNILVSDGSLFLIDPKGAPSKAELLRPIIYDLAKLSQSLIGGYDQIVDKKFLIKDYTVHFETDHFLAASFDFFKALVESFGFDLRSVRLVEATLLFSMLPFHTDDSQKMKAFFIQSLKICKDLS